MSIKIELYGENVPELAFQVQMLAEGFSGLFGAEEDKPKTTLQEEPSAPLVNKTEDAPTPPAETAAQQVAADPDKVVRGDGEDFVVRLATGRKKAGFKYGEDAVDTLLTLVNKADDIETLDKLVAANTADLVLQLPKTLEDQVETAYDARYVALGADPDADGGDGMDEDEKEETVEAPVSEVTVDTVRQRAQAFIEKGQQFHMAFAQILEGFGAKRLSDLAEENYEATLKKIAESDAELSAEDSTDLL